MERSVNGQHFEMTGTVNGHGIVAGVSNYSFVDEQAAVFATSGVVYYRLKQVDADGAYTYSKIVLATFDKVSKPAIIQPNPFITQLDVIIRLTESIPVQVSVVDMQGRIVLQQDEQILPAGSHSIRLRESVNLPEGVYVLYVQHGINRETHKLVKIR